MAVKSQRGAREAIQHLSSIIADCTIPKVPSETFRQAKFNKDEATDVLWTLLLNLVQLLSFLQSKSSSYEDIRDGLRCYSLSRTSSDRTTIQTAVLVVKTHLLSMGYARTQFYRIPPLSGSGSRELLLAFGWLLQKSQMIKRLCVYHLVAARATSIPLKPNKDFIIRSTIDECESLKTEMSQIIAILTQEMLKSEEYSVAVLAKVDEALQKLAWVRGKLLAKYISTHSSHVSYLRLAHKLHVSSVQQAHRGSDASPHLNVHQLFLLRHHDQLSAHLKKTEYHVACLQRLVLWQLHESVFWQWMGSVLDLCEREAALLLEEQKQVAQNGHLKEGEETENSTRRESLESLTDKVRVLHREVSNVLGRHKPYLEKIQRLWQMKAKSVHRRELEEEHNQAEQTLESLLLNTNQEVRSKLADIKDTTSTVERLSVQDMAIYLEGGESKTDKASTRKMAALAYPTQLQPKDTVNTKIQHESQKCHAHFTSELEDTQSHVQQHREEIQRQLYLREQQFTATICKVEN